MNNGLLLIICLVWSFPLAAAEFVCADPREATAAAKRAQPGDVIVLSDGSYHSAELVIESTGTAERPVVLRAATPGKVVLTGKSCLRIGGSYLIVDGLHFLKAFHPEGLIIFRSGLNHQAQHCRVTQCAATDCNPPAEEPAGPWISILGVGNRVDHCALQGKTYAGSVLDVWILGDSNESVSHQIDHNYFGPRPRLKSHSDGEILYVGHGATPSIASRILVEANLFDRCAGGADVVTNCASETAYWQNTFLNSTGSLTLRICNRCQVVNNFFMGGNVPLSGGVRISGEQQTVAGNYFANLQGAGEMAALTIMDGNTTPKPSGYYETKNCTVAENIFMRCATPLAIGVADRNATRKSGGRLAPRQNTISSNIVVGSRRIVDMQSSSALLDWRGNFYDAGEVGVQAPTNASAAPEAWRQTAIGVAERFGVAWPAPAPAFGPQIPPLRHADVGPAWFSIAP
jgi:poly(beta-D-mannuronate) lyase